MAAAIHYRHRQRAAQVVVRLAHLARILGGVVVGGACPHRSGVRSASAATRRNDAPVPCHTCGQLGRNSHQNSHIHRVCGWCHTPPHRLLHLFQKTFVITHTIRVSTNISLTLNSCRLGFIPKFSSSQGISPHPALRGIFLGMIYKLSLWLFSND